MACLNVSFLTSAGISSLEQMWMLLIMMEGLHFMWLPQRGIWRSSSFWWRALEPTAHSRTGKVKNTIITNMVHYASWNRLLFHTGMHILLISCDWTLCSSWQVGKHIFAGGYKMQSRTYCAAPHKVHRIQGNVMIVHQPQTPQPQTFSLHTAITYILFLSVIWTLNGNSWKNWPFIPRFSWTQDESVVPGH